MWLRRARHELLGKIDLLEVMQNEVGPDTPKPTSRQPVESSDDSSNPK